MAGDSEIRVDTKAFVTAAEEISKAQKQMTDAFDGYVKELSSLRNAWQGDTSDTVKAIANSMKNSATAVSTNLSAYCKTLNELAGVYEQHEKAAAEQTKTLGFDAGSMR